jgi:DNA polymerase-3 subunit epsilon
LVKAGQDVIADSPNDKCPTVIHFSRFEEPFLVDLYQKWHSPDAFPFRLICTHEIAKRLLPDLPRRGLRAIAGYFGHSMPTLRRSADHAVATAIIWKKLVTLLKHEVNIFTLASLLKWMKTSLPRARKRRSYPMGADFRRKLPDQSGVYRMLRASGDVLYIGKAKSLRKRVNNYFRQTGSPGEHILEMLTQAYQLDFTATSSSLEAALLETDEIKRQSPPYNVALRKGQRHIVFFSRDLQHFAQEVDESHPIGPLPSGSLNSAMTAFASLINTKTITNPLPLEKIASTLLGIPTESALEKTCLHDGVEIFRQRYCGRSQIDHPFRFLTALGARLWKEHFEQQALKATKKSDTAQNEVPPSEDDPPALTPEDVARLMENFIRRAAHLIRRSRWFCMLSEASLAWTSSAAGRHDKILISLKNGDVVHREKLGVDKSIPVPSGYAIPSDLRKQNIDLMTYDRLRVLTTELRRLIAEGRNIELCLRPRIILKNLQLEKLLLWV